MIDGTDLYTSPEDPTWLSRWFDPGVSIPEDLTVPRIVAEEQARIAKTMSVILYASTIPRRLGGEATSIELAADKRRCRRSLHALTQAHRCWGRTVAVELQTGPDVKQLGAQLEWETFQAEHLVVIQARARVVVTWAVKTGERRWAKTAATNFSSEQKWFVHSLRSGD